MTFLPFPTGFTLWFHSREWSIGQKKSHSTERKLWINSMSARWPRPAWLIRSHVDSTNSWGDTVVLFLVVFTGKKSANCSQAFLEHSKTQETSYKTTEEGKAKKPSKAGKIHETHGLRNQGDMTDNHHGSWGLGLSKTKKTANKN